MKIAPRTQPPPRNKLGGRIAIAILLLTVLAAGLWLWRGQGTKPHARAAAAKPVQVTAVQAVQADVPVKLTANGTASAIQTVEVRPQLSAVIKTVHVKEGRFVRKGDRLFSLDARTETANLGRAEAQVAKDRTDLAAAERNLERQRQLYKQEYISQSEFDAAQSQADMLRSQLEIDRAALEASRIARSYSEITAPITGRTGAIAVYPGSLVQPNGPALVSITQVDPINVSFTLPERELAALQQALAKGEVPVSATTDLPGQPALKGRVVFMDNSVDMASGAIRLKAEFPNPDNRLWPGMFVTVTLAPRVLKGAATVPVQAVQTGPDGKFIYVIGGDSKVALQPVNVSLIQDGIAAVEGVAPGTRVVVEGAQNLRPGSIVAEPDKSQSGNSAKPGTPEK